MGATWCAHCRHQLPASVVSHFCRPAFGYDELRIDPGQRAVTVIGGMPESAGFPETSVFWLVILNRRSPRRNLIAVLTQNHFSEISEMKERNAETQKKAGKFVRSADPFFRERPFLDAELNDSFWSSGKPRETCYFTTRTGPGRAMVTLNDPEGEASISTSGDNVQDTLDKLEAYLASGEPSWRPWAKKKGR